MWSDWPSSGDRRNHPEAPSIGDCSDRPPNRVIESLQVAVNRTFTEAEKQEIQVAQEEAYRWTFLGSGMSHPNFLKTLGELSETARNQVLDQFLMGRTTCTMNTFDNNSDLQRR